MASVCRIGGAGHRSVDRRWRRGGDLHVNEGRNRTGETSEAESEEGEGYQQIQAVAGGQVLVVEGMA